MLVYALQSIITLDRNSTNIWITIDQTAASYFSPSVTHSRAKFCYIKGDLLVSVHRFLTKGRMDGLSWYKVGFHQRRRVYSAKLIGSSREDVLDMSVDMIH